VTELPLPGGTSSRSYLYVPADREDRLSRAAARGADALILDLEDSVPAAGKDQARQLLAGWLARQRDTDCELWVRINPPTAAEDITAIAGTLVTGVAVPKAEPALLAESAMGVAPGRFGVLPIVETARGLQSVADVAASPRVVRLGLGEADLAADLGVQLSPHRAELLPVRLQVVVAAAAAGIGAPIGPVSTDFRDLDGLRESTRALLALGFRARSAIHPAQLPVINAVFTPSEAEIARAGQLVGAFEAAKRAGAGVFTHVDGTMVDVAVVRSAREILARAGMARPGADQRY
jgi:citrate lyase subunit beta / citryl-CoA lyase